VGKHAKHYDEYQLYGMQAYSTGRDNMK